MSPTARASSLRAPLTAAQRDALRTVLRDERRHTLATMEQLSRDIRSVQSSRQDAPTDDEHDPEGPTLAFEQSQSSALLWQARRRLELVDSALIRVGHETFGICEGCGHPIGVDRLMARPYAEHCISCAQRAGT
ncbi:MAG: TraR/DksA family transcriptional regulator [Microbacteriaceae bacterium]